MARTKQTARRSTQGTVLRTHRVAPKQQRKKNILKAAVGAGGSFLNFQTEINKFLKKQNDGGTMIQLGVLTSKNPVYPEIPIVSQSNITVGRSPKSDVVIQYEGLSSIHCTIIVEFNENGNLQVKIQDDSTNGTYIDGNKIGKGNVDLLLNKQTLSLFVSKKDPELNIEYTFQENVDGIISCQAESLRSMVTSDIKEICVGIKVDDEVSRMNKDMLIEAYKNTRIRNYNFERLEILMSNFGEDNNDTALDDPMSITTVTTKTESTTTLPQNVIWRILKYCWYQPFMGDYNLRRPDFVWKLSLSTLSREIFYMFSNELFDSESLINCTSYFYGKSIRVRFFPKSIHPCSLFTKLRKLEVHDRVFSEFFNVKKYPSLVHEKQFMDNLQVLYLHQTKGTGLLPVPDGSRYAKYGEGEDSPLLILPSMRKLKVYNYKDTSYKFPHSFKFPKLRKLDLSQDCALHSDWYGISPMLSYLTNICAHLESMKGFYHYGYAKFEGGYDDSLIKVEAIPDTDAQAQTEEPAKNARNRYRRCNEPTYKGRTRTRILTVPKSFFTECKSESFTIPDTVREIEIKEMLTFANLVAMLKEITVETFKYLIVYFPRLDFIKQIQSYFEKTNSHFSYSHYEMKPISQIRESVYKLYIRNTKFVANPKEDYLAEKILLLDSDANEEKGETTKE